MMTQMMYLEIMPFFIHYPSNHLLSVMISGSVLCLSGGRSAACPVCPPNLFDNFMDQQDVQ